MLQVRKKTGSKITAILLALMMAVVFMPTFAFAADGDEGGAAADITVYMTISDQGVIAKTKDGDAMAWKKVTVKDLDESGDFTYDEALKAAHEAYNSADGYAVEGMVKKLWGKETRNTLFFINGEGIPNGVTVDKVKKDDYLTASINSDLIYYSDWYSCFDKAEVNVGEGEEFTLNLRGHLGMAWTEEAKKNVSLSGITVGTWKDGAMVPIEGAVTDEDGDVSLSFDDVGTYVITAKGVKEDAEMSIFGIPVGQTEDGKYYVGEYVGEFDMNYFYTEKDYGDGPYPADEIKKIDMYDWMSLEKDEQADYHLVYADSYVDQTEAYYRIQIDAPLMAPCCIVNVLDTADVTVTVNNKGDLAMTKDGEPMVEQAVTAIDWNADGVISYEEALVEAHKAYYKDGAEGFGAADNGWITTLWGAETSNTLFCVNNKSISPDFPKTKAIEDGDELYASVNADDKYYVDYMSFFGETDVDAKSGKEITVNLKGFLGMGWGDQLIPAPLEGIQIGYWNDGDFVPIDGAVTDANGAATFSPDEVGDYLLTAKGTVHTTAHDWVADVDVETDAPIMAPYCFLHVEKGEGEAAPLNTIKKNALKELLNNYDPADYRTKEQVQVMSALLTAQLKILEAKSSAEVKAAVAAAKETLDAVMTDAQYKAQEDTAKAKVKAVKVTGVKAKAGKKKITVTWKKNTAAFDGYQVSYAMKGKKAKTVNIAKNTVAKKVIKKLKKGKKYKVKVRGYKTIGGAKIYGAWSAAKTVKVKK